jgi:hypothetical protein
MANWRKSWRILATRRYQADNEHSFALSGEALVSAAMTILPF